MSIVAFGLNHQTAPQDVRGRLSFQDGHLAPALHALRQRLPEAAEVAIVSTCNRTELYVGSSHQRLDDLTGRALGWLAGSGGLAANDLAPHCYQHLDVDAARHTFRLASGLSSMVMGETQVLGQLKQAVRLADGAGTLGTSLHQLFQRSFAVAKEVRSSTEIGMHTVSFAAAIVQIATNLFEDFNQLNMLLIGAGDMAGPVLAHLSGKSSGKSPRQITVANRNIERGEQLALPFGARAVGLDAALSRLAEFDVVITCTASPLPLISPELAAQAVKARRRRPILMVDLSVPRNIDAQCKQLSDIYLYAIDDLAHIVQSGADKRQAAVQKAETIIESGVADFQHWLRSRETVPLIQALQSQAEAWRHTELQRARKLLAKGESIDEVLEALSRGLTQRMLHGPMAGLNQVSAEQRGAAQDAVSKMFLTCPMRTQR
jgi:glutamyl-tRNA reductase